MNRRQKEEWASEILVHLIWKYLQNWPGARSTINTFCMYRVFKAQYFPTCSFLEATLGSNTSYAWRSLLQAREVIVGGSVWKVGDGTTIEIENHRWLPRGTCFSRERARPRYVRELVDADTRQWDRDKIAYWFEPHTRNDILLIPSNNMHARDSLTWNENRSKLFTVR